MKSTTYIAEVTTQKKEKGLSEGIIPLACLPARLMSTKKFSVFTEKCFAVFYRSSHTIYLRLCWSLLFFWEFSPIIPVMV